MTTQCTGSCRERSVTMRRQRRADDRLVERGQEQPEQDGEEDLHPRSRIDRDVRAARRDRGLRALRRGGWHGIHWFRGLLVWRPVWG